MAITDIQISEELKTDAPSIKYRGNEGPKSPQEMQQMMIASLEEEYAKYRFDMLEQGLEPMSLQQFIEQAIAEGQMTSNQSLSSDREMAAYGGIMGIDGRKQYGIGSYFQKLKDKFVDDIIPNEIKDNPELAAAAALVGANYFDVIPGSKSSKGYIGDLFENIPQSVKDAPGKVRDFIFERPEAEVMTDSSGNVVLGKDGKPIYKQGQSIAQQIGSGLAKNIVPILGGVTAGVFTKNQPEQPGLPDDTTALNLADLKKGANLATQQQGLAAGLNFLPAVSARKFTPEEMAITYAQSAANGGRIGFEEGGGIMNLGGMEKDYRETGGFVDIGAKEKADDVPARLSVNEFVMTADAVRGMGNGDINLGAKRMEDLMKIMEPKGKKRASEMFQVSERLSEVV
jgi:hypothetical protein|tara:strand:+ start:2146 stop:3342 length:1197 start_codon:yes stop_codon:yes gene_type:complete